MSDEREYIKIEVDEEPNVYQADTTAPSVGERLSSGTQQVGTALQTAWESEQRQRASEAVRRGANVAAERSRDAVQRAVSEQTRRTMRSGVAGGIYWLSEKLALLADRMNPSNKPPTQGQ